MRGQQDGRVIVVNVIVYSQLTLVALDALGGTETLPRVDMAHVGMAVTLTCCRDKGQGGEEREMCVRI